MRGFATAAPSEPMATLTMGDRRELPSRAAPGPATAKGARPRFGPLSFRHAGGVLRLGYADHSAVLARQSMLARISDRSEVPTQKTTGWLKS